MWYHMISQPSFPIWNICLECVPLTRKFELSEQFCFQLQREKRGKVWKMNYIIFLICTSITTFTLSNDHHGLLLEFGKIEFCIHLNQAKIMIEKAFNRKWKWFSLFYIYYEMNILLESQNYWIIVPGAADMAQKFLSILKLNKNGLETGILNPVPEYPFYSSAIAALGLKRMDYFIDEDDHWNININELQVCWMLRKQL